MVNVFVINIDVTRRRITPLAAIKGILDAHASIGVVFDGVHPEWIRIEKGVRITANSIILSHFINPETGRHDKGEVIIQENVFVGAGTIITKPVVIGRNSIIGAGSVVTKSIPENEVWAGNPARFIKKRSV